MARRPVLTVFVTLVALLLAARGVSAQQPKHGGVIRIAEREAPGLDPHLSISFLTHSYVSLAYSQLVRFPNGPEQKSPTDFSILPDLAEKWTTSKDGTVYTFSLRKGVRFHNKPPVNGREVTAEDVKYSLDRFMAKSGFRERFEPVKSIDVVDRYTVRITLKEPYAPFLNHLANPSYCAILPREAENKFTDFNVPDAAIGIVVGIVSAVRQDSASDYLGRVLAILALSVPYFGLAVLVVVLPSIYFKWTPVWTYVAFTTDPAANLKIMIVPALVFGVTRAGPIMRIMRSALLDVLRQDYIRTAWSKGLGERTIVLRHALKNALIPVISLIGLQLPLYIGGSVIIEAIFRLPGVGLFFFEALTRLDYPVVQSVNLIIAAMVVGLNLLIDLSYAFLDPRIRY